MSISTSSDTTKRKLRDHSGTFQEKDVVKAHKVDGVDVIDVLFRLKDASTTVLPFHIHTFTCFIRLDVYGDGKPESKGAQASLVVPSNANGPGRLFLDLVKKREHKIGKQAVSTTDGQPKERSGAIP